MTQPARPDYEADCVRLPVARLRQVHAHRSDLTSIGDCFRTCIACLTSAQRPQQVPHFSADNIAAGLDGDNAGWYDIASARRWLRETLDLDLLHVGREQAVDLGIAYTATVRSKAGPWSHAVVVDVDGTVWDPSGEDCYTLDDVTADAVGIITTPYTPEPDEMLRDWLENAA